jgi:hypothetical protein
MDDTSSFVRVLFIKPVLRVHSTMQVSLFLDMPEVKFIGLIFLEIQIRRPLSLFVVRSNPCKSFKLRNHTLYILPTEFRPTSKTDKSHGLLRSPSPRLVWLKNIVAIYD